MKMTTKAYSVLMLLSISLSGCKATQVPDEQIADRGAQQQAGSSIYINSEAQFDQLVNQGNVVVDFYAPWCGPCKQLSPIIDELAQEIQTVTFLKVNVDQFKGLSGRYGVRSMPTLFLLKDGVRLDMINGYRSKPVLRAAIAQSFSLE